MKDRDIYVSSEVVPYLAENEVSWCLTTYRRWLMIKVGKLEFYAEIWNINEEDINYMK
jgi:hypothetical protein